MAEARMGRDPRADERVGDRWGVTPGTRVHVDLLGERLTAELHDVSHEGCALIFSAPIDESTTDLQIHLAEVMRKGRGTPPHYGRIVDRELRADGQLRCGIQFDPVLSQAIHSCLDQIMTGPLRDARSRRARYESQRNLALRDLADLRASNRQFRLMQLQILLLGVPILLALLGPSYKFLLGGHGSVQVGFKPWWMLALPLGSLVFSYLIYTVFLHLAADYGKQGSFTLILERALAAASFPTGYRGWSDAAGHLQGLERGGTQLEARLWLSSEEQPAAPPASEAPGLPLLRAASATFMAIPLFALLAMWLLARELGIDFTGHTALVALSTLLYFALAAIAYAHLRRLRTGDRSFNYYYQRFLVILAHAGPFDPERQVER